MASSTYHNVADRVPEPFAMPARLPALEIDWHGEL